MVKKEALFVLNIVKNLHRDGHLYIIIKDLLNIDSQIHKNDHHLMMVMQWLKNAQDCNSDGGVSAGYSLGLGWKPSYPETSGYIMATFIQYYRYSKKSEFLERAIMIAEWLKIIQNGNGSFRGSYGNADDSPIVFNTGQILQGFVDLYKETNLDRYLDSAILAADWLVKVQGDDGAWREYTHNNMPHVYHTRVSWPMLQLYEITRNDKYLTTASKNLSWALINQNNEGWFENNAFSLSEDPFLHTIAYAIEGIIECSVILNQKSLLESAIMPSEKLLHKFSIAKKLSGEYDFGWRAVSKYSCLTGDAQMAVCWLRLYSITGDGRYLNAALYMNDKLRKQQSFHNSNSGINGGIKGSHPIWGKYLPFEYPNWAAKFFADAIMLEIQALREAQQQISGNIKQKIEKL